MHITMVKKIMRDGSPCRKCTEVLAQLERRGLSGKIDKIIVADERVMESEGMLLAKRYNVKQAPFFIVEKADQKTKIYTVFFKFIKEIFKEETSEQHEIKEIMDENPDLDHL